MTQVVSNTRAESVSRVMPQKMKKKIERATAKAAALKEVGPKYATSKKRACKDCGTLGHASMANKVCRRHEEHLRKPKKISFPVQKAVSHYRDVTSTTSLFVNFFILELLSAGMPIPPLTHTFLYDFASLVMNIGSKTLPHVIESFNCFTEMLGDTYIPERFYSQGFTTVVTAIIRSYSALIHNHVADNYKKRSLRFFLHIFDSISNYTSISYKGSMNLTEPQKAIITRLKIESARLMSPLPLTTANVGARPYLYLSWLYHVLQRMEQVDSIKEPVPEKKANKGFIHRKVKELVRLADLPRKFQKTSLLDSSCAP
ncbi:hypothetical protein INT48_004436 [Thamnidium elegans]|uniref:Uncharacterized protein n=1 Tax=Thamnidium elegans TaxID=101142 RepID=A0A8H7SLV3_9FUNG|nr:hypothetical protein INT48_004436 [Thamnidium elegans]